MKEKLQKIFSIIRSEENKIITLFGLKFTYKNYNKKIFYRLLKEINRKLDNVNFKQDVIYEYYTDAKKAKAATGMLRKYQLKDVELLKEFVRLANKHNLKYWLEFGSLVGAVRHGGFIPWDTDCDVSMPEDDFLKFKEIADNEINSNMECIVLDNNTSKRLIFKPDEMGAFLDIYCYTECNKKYCLKTDYEPSGVGSVYHYYASVPENILFPTKTLTFEGVEVQVPNDYDSYLRCRYGNYETLPKTPPGVSGHTAINEHVDFYNEL